MNYRFEFADKTKPLPLLYSLFDILHTNMNAISPSPKSYDAALEDWLSELLVALKKDRRQIVLMYDGEELVGYFQYYTTEDTLMMEEMQIVKDHQGTGLFGIFFARLLPQLPEDLKSVEAYTNVKNMRSQKILKHLGLSPDRRIGDDMFHYKGEYAELLRRYSPHVKF